MTFVPGSGSPGGRMPTGIIGTSLRFPCGNAARRPESLICPNRHGHHGTIVTKQNKEYIVGRTGLCVGDCRGSRLGTDSLVQSRMAKPGSGR